MTKETLIGLLVFIVGMLIAFGAIVTEDGSMDEKVGWEWR